jgi:hypothetical protein
MTEADRGNVMCSLDELGAWMQDLKNCEGTMRLRFSTREANLRGFGELPF